MTMNNVMIDLETLGTEPGAVILSIAAVQFNEHTGETGEYFYEKIALQNSLDLGLNINADTLKWWIEKDGNVFKEALSGKKTLVEVLSLFSDFLNKIKLQHDNVCLWGNSARFDLGILSEAHKKAGLKLSWDTWLEVCFRTFIRKHKELRKAIPFLGKKHYPIDDCYHQILVVNKINELK